MPDIVASARVPDSAIARVTTQLVRDNEDDLLYDHSRCAFFWGRDRISLSANPAVMNVGKSYINCTEDIAAPHSHPWHPRLSEKLGLFRLIQIPGSHEVCFTNPPRLARAIMDAGRD
jgi:hypothetical protein